MIKSFFMIGFLCAQTLFDSIAYADQPTVYSKPVEYIAVRMDVQDFNFRIAKLFEQNGFRRKFEAITHKLRGDDSVSRYKVECIFDPMTENQPSLLSVHLEVMIIGSGDPIYFETLEFKKFVLENNEDKRKAIEAVFEGKELTIKNAISELFQPPK